VDKIPRGVEMLIIRAAIDSDFRKLLLEKRAEAAKLTKLELTAAEAAMINAIPAAQLKLVIAQTRASKKKKLELRRRVAGAMLAALGAGGLKYSCDRWMEYERERQKPKPELIFIAGVMVVPEKNPVMSEEPFPPPAVHDADAGAEAGSGERQAKELTNGEG
jgi:hypothetical protein